MTEATLPLAQKWRQAARALKTETLALYLAYKHPRTPWYAKGFAGLVVAYAFSPLDLIPDFIPVLGYLDDLVLVPLGVALALKMIPPDVMEECRAQAGESSSSKPTSHLAVVLIIALWIGLAWLALLWMRSLFA
jgi:uncharacterized membrane protein YkvA (DUF1232 family)